MPNGGPDNCATCGFNRINSGQWTTSGEAKLEPGYCTIRNLSIVNPHWTYCKNWHSRETNPEGPVFSSMYDEGYRRVPWLSHTAPETGIDAVCVTCGIASANGIRISLGNERFQ